MNTRGLPGMLAPRYQEPPLREECGVCDLVHVREPAILGRGLCLDGRSTALAH